MSNIIEAEYRVVPERTLPVIASEIIQIEQNLARITLDSAIRIGMKLKEAKEKVEHGQWENWCHENLNYSKSKAEKLMRIATEYGDENSAYANPYTFTDLSVSKAFALLQVPEEEVESFIENHDINDMTVKELNDEISKLKEQVSGFAEENDQLERQAEEYKEKHDSLNMENENLKKELEDLKAAGADTEKIKDLEVKLEKQKEKTKELQEEVKRAKADKDSEIEAAVNKERESLEAEAEKNAADKLRQEREKSEALSNQIKNLEKKIENSSREELIKFKLRVDQLQDVFAECCLCIDSESDPQQQAKMRNALQVVLAGMKGEDQ